jgi:hypothetical protein
MCAVGTSALAQTPVKFEVMGGYSYMNVNPRSVSDVNAGDISFPSGWQGAFTYFVKEGIGLAVEVRGHSTTKDLGPVIREMDATLHTFMAGARLAERKGMFGGALRLLGGKAWTTTESPTADRVEDSSFSASFGGEFDIMFGGIGIRVVQADVVWTQIGKQNPTYGIGAGVFYQW